MKVLQFDIRDCLNYSHTLFFITLFFLLNFSSFISLPFAAQIKCAVVFETMNLYFIKLWWEANLMPRKLGTSSTQFVEILFRENWNSSLPIIMWLLTNNNHLILVGSFLFLLLLQENSVSLLINWLCEIRPLKFFQVHKNQILLFFAQTFDSYEFFNKKVSANLLIFVYKASLKDFAISREFRINDQCCFCSFITSWIIREVVKTQFFLVLIKTNNYELSNAGFSPDVISIQLKCMFQPSI